MKKILIIASCLVVASLSFLAACDTHEKKSNHEVLDEKPVVYVYPEEEQGLTMTIDVKGTLDMVYPAPERQVQTEEGTRASWTISAAPDGTLTDASGRSYPYVFWEGPVRQDTPERGFIVAREDAVPFLEEKLGQLGLSDKEAADFITFWAPRIRSNESPTASASLSVILGSAHPLERVHVRVLRRLLLRSAGDLFVCGRGR